MEEELPISIPKLFPKWEVYNKVTIFTVSLSRYNNGWAKQTYGPLGTPLEPLLGKKARLRIKKKTEN